MSISSILTEFFQLHKLLMTLYKDIMPFLKDLCIVMVEICVYCGPPLTPPMLRLLSSKGQGSKDF